MTLLTITNYVEEYEIGTILIILIPIILTVAVPTLRLFSAIIL